MELRCSKSSVNDKLVIALILPQNAAIMLIASAHNKQRFYFTILLSTPIRFYLSPPHSLVLWLQVIIWDISDFKTKSAAESNTCSHRF